jgi:hypothetical protein
VRLMEKKFHANTNSWEVQEEMILSFLVQNIMVMQR